MRRLFKPEVLRPIAITAVEAWPLLRRLRNGGGPLPLQSDVDGAVVRALLDLDARLREVEDR